MTAADLQLLGKLADMCRRKGVKTAHCGDVHLEMGTLDAPPKKAQPDTEKCACGHPAYQHVHGLCLDGCEPDKCGEAPQ